MTRALVAYASAGQTAIVLDLVAGPLACWRSPRPSRCSPRLLFGSSLRFAPPVDAALDGRRDLGRARHATVVLARGWSSSRSPFHSCSSSVRGCSCGPSRISPHESDLDQSRVLMIVRVEPRGSGERNKPGAAERSIEMYRPRLAKIESLPGVQSVTSRPSSPLATQRVRLSVRESVWRRAAIVHAPIVYPRYFATMGIPS